MGLFKKLHQIDVERQAKHPDSFLATKAEQYKQQTEQRQAERQEHKAETQAAKDTLEATRGKELGHVSISYVGGFDNDRRYNAKLRLYEKQVEYSQLGKPVKGLVIPATDIVSLEVTGQQQTNSRLSVTRMATLGVFSLAAPKRTKVKDATVIIGLKDGREVMFHTTKLTEFEVHSKLANAISHYKSLQVAQTNQQQPQTPPTDSAQEILKYATLHKKGAITAEEYQAKKRQLLGL
jgi:hypothetical protein